MERKKLELKDSSMNLDLTLDQINGMSLEELKKFSHNLISKMKVDKNLQAKIIASYVRNNIENFHCKYLSDGMMKELNTLIRNAIYTALVDFESEMISVILFNMMCIPTYWEDCEYCQTT